MELRFWNDPETGEKSMKEQRLLPGWTEKRIHEVAAYYDRQTEQEQGEEMEAALSAKDQTLMAVPTKLVPEIQALIARKRGE